MHAPPGPPPGPPFSSLKISKVELATVAMIEAIDCMWDEYGLSLEHEWHKSYLRNAIASIRSIIRDYREHQEVARQEDVCDLWLVIQDVGEWARYVETNPLTLDYPIVMGNNYRIVVEFLVREV